MKVRTETEHQPTQRDGITLADDVGLEGHQKVPVQARAFVRAAIFDHDIFAIVDQRGMDTGYAQRKGILIAQVDYKFLAKGAATK